jgi:cell division protein FtsL
MATILVVCTAAAVSQIWTRLRVIEYGYKISAASKEHTRLVELNRQLRIEIALLKRPERIMRLAKEQLGMQAPQPEQIRRLPLEPTRPRGAPRGHNPSAVARVVP